MSERKIIVHKTIMIGGLMLSVAALPFSVKACHAGLIIVLVAWALEGQWHGKMAIIRHSVLLQAIIAFFLLQSLGLLFSENLGAGWFSLEKKIFFLLIPLALATTVIKFSEGELRSILIAFLIACFAGTVVCIVQAWHQADLFLSGSGHVNAYLATSPYTTLNPGQSQTWLFFSYVGLSGGIGIHPTYLSLYLALCILFMLHRFGSLKGRGLRMAVAFLILYFSIFVAFLSSRIIIAGLSSVYVFLLVKTLATRERGKALALIPLVLVFAFLIFENPVTRYRNLQEINLSTFQIEPNRQYRTAAQIRASLWWIALRSLRTTDPIFGTGASDVKRVMSETSKHYGITNVLNSFDPHNQYLYTLLSSGYPGAFLLMFLFILPFYTGYVYNDYLLAGFAFLFSLVCLTESALELQKGIVFYAMFSSLLFFQPYTARNVALNAKSVLRESRQ